MSSAWEFYQQHGYHVMHNPQQPYSPQQPNDTLYRPIPQQPLPQQPLPNVPHQKRGCGCGGK